MQSLMRIVCIAYVVFLTALLLTANPMQWIGVRGSGPSLLRSLMPAAHLLSFGVLAALALMTRWPAPRWAVAVLLAAYAGLTEVAQSFVPPRTAEWADWLQDLGGIVLAAVVCWLAATMAEMRTKAAWQSEPCGCIEPFEQDEPARRPSWWA